MVENLSTMATFVQAAESRSFSDAGRQLGISASAVGKAIARLEERIGVRLFARSTRSVTLTSEGQVFLQRCRRIFCEIRAAELEIAQVVQEPIGRLKVGMPLIGMLLTPAISAFALAHPQIELDIDFSDRLVDVIDEGYDVVLRTGAASDSQLVSRLLGTYSYAIIASPAYLARAGKPQVPEDLLRHACLHHRWPSNGKLEGWRLMRDQTYLDLDLPVNAVSSSIEPLIGMAERGVGIISMPTFAVRRQLNEGTLVPILDQFLSDTGTLRMMWPKDRQLLPRLRVFIDFMRAHLLDAMAYR